MTAQRAMTAIPDRMARVLLTAMMAGVCYLDYFGYRNAGFGEPGVWDDLLQGRGPAPEQYRMGMVWVGHALSLHLHLKLPMVLAGLDGVCGLAALLILLRVLERTEIYARASVAARWLGAAAFVLLAQWFLTWLLWMQKPETLPAAMLVALMVGLWQRPWSGEQRNLSALRSTGIAAILVVLTLLLALVRADVACLFNAGVLLAVTLRRGQGLSLRRGWALVASAAGMLTALDVQVWMMRFRYPQANYGRVKMWQLRPNVVHVSRWPPFVIFLLPLAWMTVQVWRRRFSGDAIGIATLLGAVVYLGLWMTIGKIDEVRIFLPMAFALIPLTVEMTMLGAEQRMGSAKMADITHV